MYKVIKSFTDKMDNRYSYNVGDTFPRAGLVVSEDRYKELATDKNRRGMPLIELVEEKAEETPVEEKSPEEVINPPEEAGEETVEEPKPKKRGRKKNAD